MAQELMLKCAMCQWETSIDRFHPRWSTKLKGKSDCCYECDLEFEEYGRGIKNRAEALAKAEQWWAENAGVVEQWKAEYSLERMLEKLRQQGEERQAAIIRATPPWANQRKIAAIYDEAERMTRITGKPHHVDHMVPLLGPKAKFGPFKGERLVHGFHCEANLRVIPGNENCSKSNKYWPDMVENNGYSPKISSCKPKKSYV